MEIRRLFNQAKGVSAHQLLLIIMAVGFLGALYPAQRVLAAGYRNGCFEFAPSGWTRTIYWVQGQRWTPGKVGPWNPGTLVSVSETNDTSKPTCSSTGSEAYQDGQLWWGTFRRYYRAVGRGDGWQPSFGRVRFNRDTWWSGWTRPAIGGLGVAGYWLQSTASGGPGDESVFVAADEEIWPEDPPATPTPTTPPPPTATFSPRTLAIQVRACTAGGGFVPSGDVTINAWTGSWSQSAQSSNVAWSVPGQYTQAGYSVTLNPRWAVISGSSTGTVNVPATVQLVAWSDTCNTSPNETPTPTTGRPPSPGCQTWHDQWLDSIPLFTPRNVLNRNNQPVNLPTAPGNNVPYLRPDQTTFDFYNDRAFPFDGDNDWEGGSIVAYHKNELGTALELYNVTTGGSHRSRAGVMENIYTTAHGTWGGMMEIQGAGLNGPTTRLGSWPVYQQQATYRPMPVDTVGLRVRFAGPLPEGLYRIRVTNKGIGQGNGWSMKDWDDGRTDLNCPIGYREFSYYFRVGEPPTPTPTATRTSTAPTATLPPNVTPTVTNTPTRTPTPTPPPPPVAEPDFHLRIHSPYDPQHGVYRSDTNEITWPLGERLNWMPDVDLVLPPDTDPYYNFRSRVIAWSFVSSLGKHAKTSTDSKGRSGCRAREEPTSADLSHIGVSDMQGCVYRYKENPTEADILRQAHTMWTSFLPADMAADVYVYKLPEIKSADLVVEIKILVEVVQANTGTVVGFATQVERQGYKVNFAIPRSTK